LEHKRVKSGQKSNLRFEWSLLGAWGWGEMGSMFPKPLSSLPLPTPTLSSAFLCGTHGSRASDNCLLNQPVCDNSVLTCPTRVGPSTCPCNPVFLGHVTRSMRPSLLYLSELYHSSYSILMLCTLNYMLSSLIPFFWLMFV
jgi:hypothetical protein